MTPAEVHAWVVARWTQQRDLAQDATPGQWVKIDDNEGSGHPPMWAVVNDAYLNPPTVDSGLWLAVRIDTGRQADAAHIAAWDPTFAIAVCDAALARLQRHRPMQNYDGAVSSVPEVACDWCANGQGRPMRWPCPEFLGDAAPFADRDDYPQKLSADGRC
jgi:hypothetical protein